MKKIAIGIGHTVLGLIILFGFFFMLAAGNHGKLPLIITSFILSAACLYAIYEIDRHLAKLEKEEVNE